MFFQWNALHCLGFQAVWSSRELTSHPSRLLLGHFITLQWWKLTCRGLMMVHMLPVWCATQTVSVQGNAGEFCPVENLLLLFSLMCDTKCFWCAIQTVSVQGNAGEFCPVENLLLLFSHWVMSISLRPHGLQPSTSLHCLQEFAQIHVIELVMLSNHLILSRPPLLLPSIFPSIRDLALCIRWPKYWSFCISPSSEYRGLSSLQSKGTLRRDKSL